MSSKLIGLLDSARLAVVCTVPSHHTLETVKSPISFGFAQDPSEEPAFPWVSSLHCVPLFVRQMLRHLFSERCVRSYVRARDKQGTLSSLFLAEAVITKHLDTERDRYRRIPFAN